jgi:hypothetical protein
MKTKSPKKKTRTQSGQMASLDSGPWFGSLRECATKVERAYQRGTWDHCPERVVCSFVDRGERVPLCERCARNVRNGAYGARLRDLLNEQVPSHDQK